MEQSNSWQWQLFPGLLSCKLTWKTGAIIPTIRLIMKLEGAGMQAAGRAWKLATGNLVAELGSVEAWESYEPADRIHIWWVVNLLSRIPGSWFVSGRLGFFSYPFCCLFWFLTCPSRQYVRSSSGHFSLDLYMLCKLLGFGKWLQTRHLMLLSMR